MDDSIRSTLQIRKATKKAKSKKSNNKPIKVVYISNPMKVKTSASKFRDLVQKLTGQYAELPDPTKFTDTEDAVDDGDDGGYQRVPDAEKNTTDDHAREVPFDQQQYSTITDDKGVPFDTFDDDVFTPQMLDNFLLDSCLKAFSYE